MSASKLRSQSVLNDLSFVSSGTTSKEVSTAVKKSFLQYEKIDKKLFVLSLISAYNYATGNADSADVFQQLQQQHADSQLDFIHLYAHLIKIATFAVQQKSLNVKKEVFLSKLTDLGVSKDFSNDVCKVVYEERSQEVISQKENNLRLAHLEQMRWRVYVAISTSVLNRVLEPTIMIEMKSSDGSIKTFEVSLSKFHELRYNVTYLLKEMESITKKN